MNFSDNPYAVTTEFTSPAAYYQWGYPELFRRRSYLALLGGILATDIVGSAAAVWEVQTILASGPILLSLGVIHLIVTRGGRGPGLAWIGLASVVYPLFCFAVINLFGWGPKEAQQPISWMCVVFTVSVILGVLVTIRRSRRRTMHEQAEAASPFAQPGRSHPG